MRFHERMLGVFCCGHVFRHERPIRLVGRQDGDWQFLCGGADHDNGRDGYHVSIGALRDFDPTLDGIADLQAEWVAERKAPGLPWARSKAATSASKT